MKWTPGGKGLDTGKGGGGDKTQEAGGGWEQGKDESVSRRLLDGG